MKRELKLAEKTHVRNEIANSRGNTNAIWKILNRCMSRGIAKRPSTLEDHKTLANKFNKYFTSVGKLTAYKANLIIEEQGFDKEWGPREERMEIGLHAEQEGFEFQNVNERSVSSWFLISKRDIQVHQKDILELAIHSSCLKALDDRVCLKLNQVLSREFKVKSSP